MKSDTKFNSVLPKSARLFMTRARESTLDVGEPRDALDAVRSRMEKTFAAAIISSLVFLINSSRKTIHTGRGIWSGLELS